MKKMIGVKGMKASLSPFHPFPQPSRRPAPLPALHYFPK